MEPLAAIGPTFKLFAGATALAPDPDPAFAAAPAGSALALAPDPLPAAADAAPGPAWAAAPEPDPDPAEATGDATPAAAVAPEPAPALAPATGAAWVATGAAGIGRAGVWPTEGVCDAYGPVGQGWVMVTVDSEHTEHGTTVVSKPAGMTVGCGVISHGHSAVMV